MRARTRSRENAVFSVDASRRKMWKREGPSTSGPRTRSKASRGGRDEREIGNTQHLLDKLPQEVWEKILDELKNADLFPLALSCRYFRQKQKELVARSRQSGPERWKPCMILRTNLRRNFESGQPASVEYLRFCSKEKGSRHDGRKKAHYIRCLAAFHGHLPLLQEILEPANELDVQITEAAGEYTFHSLFFFVLASDFFLSFSSSQRAEAKWRPCSG